LRHRIAIWLRMNLFIPDARIGWYWNAVKKGKHSFRNQNIDAIVSIGPPHTTLLVGKKLSTLLHVPHVPVFIDPWVDISYYTGLKRSKIAVSVDRKLEASVIAQARQVVFVTESMKEDFIKRYSVLRHKSNVLYWGYDEQPFETYTPQSAGKEEILLHAGNLYDHQNPIALWKTLKHEMGQGRNIKIVFVGTVGPAVRHAIQEAGLMDRTIFKGFLSYEKMLTEISSASYLLVCASEKRHVPGKLFEYLRSGKPIIAFGNENREVRKILTDANAGILFSLNEDGKEFFGRVKSLHTNQTYVQQYERKEVARALSNILLTL